MSVVKARRPYRTSIRRGDAPAAICAAAERLFITKGYLATSVQDIAAEAGVARPTVFSAVGPKPVILKVVIDRALAGDDAPVAIAHRPWWQEAIAEPDPRRSLQLHARNMTRVVAGIAPLWPAIQTAALLDHGVAAVWHELLAQRRSAMTEYARALATKAALRNDIRTTAEIMWALVPDTYLRLVHDLGWAGDRYETWLANILTETLLAPAVPALREASSRQRRRPSRM